MAQARHHGIAREKAMLIDHAIQAANKDIGQESIQPSTFWIVLSETYPMFELISVECSGDRIMACHKRITPPKLPELSNVGQQ